MRQLFANNISTTLSSTLSSSATTLTVTSAAGFPVPAANQYFLVTIQSGSSIEIIEISSVNGTTFTISGRAQEGTTAQSFPSGSLCEMRITAGTMANLEAEATQLSALSALVAPQSTTVDAYAVQDTLDPAGMPLYLVAASNTMWDPVNYTYWLTDAAASIATTTTLNTTVGSVLPATPQTNTYLVQITTGTYAGRVLSVTAATASVITFTPALPSVVAGTINVILYQHDSLLRLDLTPYQYNGRTGANYVLLTGNTTLTAAQSGLDFFGPAAAATVTLPAPAAGIKYRIITGTGNIVLTPNGGTLILQDGNSAATWTIPGNTGSGAYLICDGTNWRVEGIGNGPVVAAALGNQPVNLSQMTNETISPAFLETIYSGGNNFTTLPTTYDTNQQFVVSASTATSGITMSTTDARIYAMGVGPLGVFWRSGLNFDFTQTPLSQFSAASLTGALTGTSATFSGLVSGANATGGQNLLTWSQSTNGSFSPTYAALTVSGTSTFNGLTQVKTGQYLQFGAAAENTDTMAFVRTNVLSNVSKVAAVMGDDGAGSAIPAPTGGASSAVDYFSIESSNIGIHHLFGTDGTYINSGSITSYGTVSGQNASSGQNYLTWAQSTNGSFAPSYGAVTATSLTVNGTATVNGNATFQGVVLNQIGSGITWTNGGNVAIYQDTSGYGPGDLVIRTGTGTSNYFCVFTSTGIITTTQALNVGATTVGGTLTVTGGSYYNNGAPMYAKDTTGNYQACFVPLDGSNDVTLINGGAAHTRVVNQAYNAELWYCDNSGNTWSAGNVTAYSDERVKKDWAPLPSDIIYKLAKLEKSGTYTRTDEALEGQRQAGVGAQSFAEIFPEAVLETRDGTFAVNYGNAALTLCVELAKKIVELEAQIKELQ